MKLTGIFVLALVLASAVVAQQVAAEPLEEIKFKIVIGKMTQEPMFESVGFLKILKIAKKLAPLVVRENQTLDELKWKVIITKLAQETAILEAGSQEQNAKDVIKKIINGIIHFIVKSEAPLEQWKIIISKATEQPETLAPAVDTKETNIITKLLKKVIINGVIHWISTRATNESLVAKK